MKKVDVIFPANINATIGPTGTLRRLLKNKDYLKKRGYELEIFTYDYLVSGGKVEAVDFTKGLSQRSKVKQYIKRNSFFSMLFVLRRMWKAKLLVEKYATLGRTPDIVIFHEVDACYAYLKQVKSPARKVCFFHSNGKRWEMFLKSWPKLKNSFFLNFLNKRMDFVIRSLDRYVFIARIGQQNFLRENPAIEASKTVFFHNGIDDKPLVKGGRDRSDFKYRLCCTGTVCRRKGQYLIIEALYRLDKEIREQIHLSLFGTGADLSVLQDRVIEYKLVDQVTFYGNVANNEIHEKLCQEDIFVLMSDNEGLPISIIEAMRAGLPVISTNVAGIPEQVEPLYNGVLIEPNADALLEVLKHINDYDWKTMGQNSRRRFEKEFSFDQMLRSYCDMLDLSVK